MSTHSGEGDGGQMSRTRDRASEGASFAGQRGLCLRGLSAWGYLGPLRARRGNRAGF